MLARGNGLVFACTLFIWMKLYAVQRFMIQLPVRSWTEEIMVLAGTLSSAVLLTALILLTVRTRHPQTGLLIGSAVLNMIVMANVIYFRFFHDLITIPVLFQSSNVSTLQHSLFALVHPWDFLIVADTFIVGVLLLFRNNRLRLTRIQVSVPRTIGALLIVFVSCLGFNLTSTFSVPEEGASRVHDRIDVVKQAGLVNYQLFDAATYLQQNTKKWFAEEDDLDEVEEQLEMWTEEERYGPLWGAGRHKNVIMVSIESLQAFALETEIAGEEVTPFLNELIKESYYFTEYYDQTAQGKTSDAEFIVETSLYPLASGAVFFLQADNEYETLAKQLKQAGYYTAVFHANDGEFWNRTNMYDAIGYDHFYDVESFTVSADNQIGWGLADKPFFEQSTRYLEQLPQPFMGKWITLTNHHPFEIDLYDDWKNQIPTENEVVRQYFATARYTDEALAHFFELLKQEGLYEQSIFVLYGDHYGLSPLYEDHLQSLLEWDEHGAAETVSMKRVPLIIHIPGMKGQRMDTVGGHIDLRPTLLHVLGIRDDGLGFGHNLFAIGRPERAVFRNGSFVTDEVVFTDGACYNKSDGSERTETDCSDEAETAITQLRLSDEIIYGDLLRFEDSE